MVLVQKSTRNTYYILYNGGNIYALVTLTRITILVHPSLIWYKIL